MDCYERKLVRGAADGAAGPTALVTGMLGYIDREFAACSLEGMAAEFGLSPNYATALLKRHVGKTFRQLVQERRLVRAAELLRGGATAGAAAHAVGYENMSFFYFRNLSKRVKSQKISLLRFWKQNNYLLKTQLSPLLRMY